jgi:hypothetical protein
MFSFTNFFLLLRIASFKFKPIQLIGQEGIMNTEREREREREQQLMHVLDNFTFL